MAFCPRCGNRNEDDAHFCKGCGAPMAEVGRDFQREPQRRRDKECEPECDKECSGKTTRSTRIFWGVIILLIGLWIIFEFGISNIAGMPQWVYDFEFWWIFAVIIGLAIIIAAIRMIFKKD
ncbi:MAG: zinc-ribbon domain-containing protein [Thermoplasmata archaeon]|nr:zinc-ribbon domain-containing protein [Thermoplasmata archaeon]